MALLTNKADFVGIQTSLGQMWQMAQLSFTSTIPQMVQNVWGTSYNVTTKLVETRNNFVNNSNYHNQTFSGINTMAIAIGSTELFINTPVDLYAGETITSANNSLVSGTIAVTGINSTQFFLTTSSGVTATISHDPFYINNPAQTTYLDASNTLATSFRNIERTLAALPATTLSSVSSALNTFYITNTGFGLKSYFDPLRTTTGLGFTNIDWNTYFVNMWAATRSEDLVLRSGFYVSNGTSFIVSDPTAYGAGINTSYTVANGIRLRITSTAPTTINNYTLAYTSGSTLVRTLTSPIVIASGTSVTSLENGSAQFIGLVSIGASNTDTGAIMEIFNL